MWVDRRSLAFFAATTVAAVLLASRAPQAAPGLTVTGITGSAAHGNTVTLSGSGFGTKPTAAPLKFDSFEGGGNASAVGAGWNTLGTAPKYSNAIKRTNSNMSVRAEFTNGAWLSGFGLQGQSLPRVYFDAWYYLDAAAPYSRNHKLFRIYTNGDGKANLYYNIYCDGQGSSHLSQDGVTGNFHKWIGIPASYFGRKWVHLQGYFVESSPGTNNGTAEFWIDGVKQMSEVGTFRTRDSSYNWSEFWIGQYFGHDQDTNCPAYGNGYTYWDDVYLDTSAARVEIGDASTYANSRHREIQLPVTWSDNSITVKLNLGTFSSASGLYLYVIDAAGNASPGYALTGGGPTTTMPQAPKNLRIVP